MYPDLFSIGPLTIHTYGLFVVIGFVVGILVTVRIGKARGISSQQIMDMGFVMILSAIIGSRLTYVLTNLSYYKAHPIDILRLWHGGLVFSGGLIAVIIVMGWYIRRHNYSLWEIGDLWSPAVALGQSIGRIGCFMAGCCYGNPTDMKWGVIFTHPKSLAPLNIALHPTQLYSFLSGLIIFIVLVILHTKKKFAGQVFLWFLILHSTGRLLIERFRGDDRGLIFGSEWTMTQLLTTLILVAAVVALFIVKSRKEKDLNDHKIQG
ncbi:MAG: prolipoprotein diacylglyceryl transferase [Deltaproteobacteria bacterium]|nr:prolipoprotein diacylglyceryl transferase [Deltaproteobacteria bacterium]